jgi:zinc protease
MLLAPLGLLHADPPSAPKTDSTSVRDKSALPKKVTSVEGITEYKLDNGVRVLLFPDKSVTKVTVNMVVFVGSRHEGYGEAGMAHLLEHMLFKGTPRHSDIPKAIRDRGAKIGDPHTNATTSEDRTNYFETLPASDENLEFALDLEADRLVNSLLRREDLASEMTVVRNEFEASENDPQGVLAQRMRSAAFNWHNYGKDTIGNKSDIERVPIERLQVFYKKHYRPDNILVIVAGKFDEAKALGHLAKHFGALKRPATPIETTYTEEPAQDGEHQVVLRRVGKVGTVSIMYHIPALAHPDCAALIMLGSLLGDAPHGRLYKEMVETKQIDDVGASPSLMHDPGTVSFSASVDRAKDPRAVRDRMIELIEQFSKSKVTTEDLDRVKKMAANGMQDLMRDPNGAAYVLGNWAACGDWRLGMLLRDRIEKVTAEDIARVAEKYFKRSNRTVGLYIPTDESDRAAIPETPDLNEAFKDFQGRQSLKAGEAFEPTPVNIEKRVERTALPSGVKLALLPKQTRDAMVVVRLELPFGNVESLKGKAAAIKLLDSMLVSGTKQHTRQQLADDLNALNSGINVTSSAGQLSVVVTSTREHLAATLQIMTEILREPTFPAKEFEIAKNQQLKALEASADEPGTQAYLTLARQLCSFDADDVRYIATVQEEIARMREVQLDDIVKLYREQIGGQMGQAAVVGEFDSDTVVKCLAESLKDWKTEVKYERIPANTPKTAAGRKVIQTPDKANAVYMAALTFALRDDDPDYAAMRLANFIFGEAPLVSRLSARVRVKDGLSYGVNSSMSVTSEDKSGAFFIGAICNPANIDKVNGAVADELEKMFKDGPTEKEVEEGKKALLESFKLLSDESIALRLTNGLRLGSTMEYYAELERRIEKLTAAEVTATFRKYVDPKKLTIVEAGDFQKEVEKNK